MFHLTQEEIMKDWVSAENDKPVVSVRCLAYNHEKYICRMLDSVLMQKTNFSFQIVIHDDASTDKTQAIIQEYIERYPKLIVAILEKENQYSKGIDALNKIIDPYITGEYVCRLEGDDYWIDENKLQEQYEFLSQHPQYSLVASRRVRVDETEKIIPYKHFTKDIVYSGNDIFHLPEMIHLSTWMHRNFLNDEKNAKKYKQFLKTGVVGDWLHICFFADMGDIYVSKKCYSARRVILRPDASNYNSIMRYKQNQFDVQKKAMLSEYNMSRLSYDRLMYSFPAIKYLARYRLSYMKSSAEERTYAKKIYKKYYIPRTNIIERTCSFFFMWYPIIQTVKEKIFMYRCEVETQNELGNLI